MLDGAYAGKRSSNDYAVKLVGQLFSYLRVSSWK